MSANEGATSSQSSKSGLAMFTHRMKESLGLAEKRTSNEQVRDISKKLDTIAEHMKMLMKGIGRTTGSLRGTL